MFEKCHLGEKEAGLGEEWPEENQREVCSLWKRTKEPDEGERQWKSGLKLKYPKNQNHSIPSNTIMAKWMGK